MASENPKPAGELISMSLLIHGAAQRAGVPPFAAIRFLDELVALPDGLAERVIEERRHERVRRANAEARRRSHR